MNTAAAKLTAARAQHRLSALGYIESGYDDDQPTSWATDAGKAALEA